MVELENCPAVGVVHSLQVGRGAALGPNGVLSGFVKRRVSGPIDVGPSGLAGDEQVDRRVHGGPDKAVYAYALSNYATWQSIFSQHAELLVPGGFGENLALANCDEVTICAGDVISIGTVVLQVREPRQPCFKLALRFGDDAMPKAMVKNGLCGWYFRVLESGSIDVGQSLHLRERPNPAWPISRVNRLITQRRATASERTAFARRQRSSILTSGAAGKCSKRAESAA